MNIDLRLIWSHGNGLIYSGHSFHSTPLQAWTTKCTSGSILGILVMFSRCGYGILLLEVVATPPICNLEGIGI